jgi:hypothetical protein
MFQRIDFNLAGRSESQVNEPEYTAWAVNTCETESKEVEDADGNPITITLANDDSYAGRKLKSCWFKNGLSSSKLIADGFAIYGYEDGINTAINTNEEEMTALLIPFIASILAI